MCLNICLDELHKKIKEKYSNNFISPVEYLLVLRVLKTTHYSLERFHYIFIYLLTDFLLRFNKLDIKLAHILQIDRHEASKSSFQLDF